jgi:alpha-methylacyl-CoA racemase
VCLTRNPRLVYGRLTGWGQDGPLAHAAGHDLNYVALTGAVHSIGPLGGAPVLPLQILGDFAGGGMVLAYGVACALVEVSRSGKGQVVDAAMVDGVMAIMGVYYSMANSGMWTEQRGTNLFDGGAHFYNVYETADGRHVSVASIEPQFYALLMKATGLDDDPDFAGGASQWDRARWPALRDKLAAVFLTRTRDEWCAALVGSDACFAPVLTLGEDQTHPHTVARSTIVPLDPETGTGVQVTAVPRLSRTPGTVRPSPHHPGADTRAVLSSFGFGDEEIGMLRSTGTVR